MPVTINGSGTISGVPGAILQVVDATTSTQVSSTSASYVTTGLTASITPRFTTSKILVMAAIAGGKSDSLNYGYFTLFRGSVSGTRFGMETMVLNTSGNLYAPFTLIGVDSPATTSSVTYLAGMRTASGTVFAQWNGGGSNMTSQIILMEVAA